MTYDGVAAISFTSDLIDQIDNMLRSLDIVIVVLIVSAGLLAFVVENRIHVVPPCTISAEQVAKGLAIFDAVFARFASLAK